MKTILLCAAIIFIVLILIALSFIIFALPVILKEDNEEKEFKDEWYD